MKIVNVEISRVIAHEVVRASVLEERPPFLNTELVTLDDGGKRLVANRLVSTMSSGSHCVAVTVDDASEGSPFQYAVKMMDESDEDFVKHSRLLAEGLCRAQTAGSIKAGVAIFAQGTCVADGSTSRFFAIIKADPDHALTQRVKGENITLEYVRDVVLSESQRLIKIALLVEDAPLDGPADRRKPEDFSIKVYDHMMQNSGNGLAATYFYSTFLKCKIAASSARSTRDFYDVARNFISSLDLPDAEKVELKSDLISHLRGNRATIEPRAFASDVLPHDHQDHFIQACREKGIGDAFSKSLDLLKGKLRRQSVKFTSNVTLYAPADSFGESVKIIGRTAQNWTSLEIKGTVEEIQ